MNEQTKNHDLQWYLGGVGSYFFSGGIQGVLLPWLLTIVLHESADRVGIAQMFSMLPMLVLGLFGGVTADRAELRKHLTRLQLFAAIPPLVLVGLLYADMLTYEAMIIYAVALATLGAFTMPARDSLLTRVANSALGGQIQKAVSMATGTQFLAQVLGLLAGGAAVILGAPALLIAQSAVLVLSAITTMRLPKAPPARAKPQEGVKVSRLQEIREGIDIVWQDPYVRPVVLMMFFSGVLYIGVFMVLFPILIRDVYGGSSLELALINVCFFGGIGVSSMVQARLRPIRRQGRAIMLAMCTGTTVMMFLYLHPPLEVVYLLALGWGLGAGVTMNQSRAIVQAAASDSHRARVLSVFQIGSMGGGPIGAIFIGYVISAVGPLNAVLVPSSFMVVLWLIMFFFSELWRVESRPPATN